MSILRRAGLFALALVWCSAAGAQAPAPLPPEAAEIGRCLCVQQAMSALAADMNAKNQVLQQQRDALARLDAEVAAQRSRVDVNSPESVARFKQLLERRDALARRANGQLVQEARAATERYNARTNEFNARCANHPFDPVLMSQVQATLSCPSPY
ncbi:MAG: hypothetical protein JO267_02850 [Alphaproteobacteria bacterium]|nr:hypothetical protein [Alphaproteobacteria bacterium]MBV9861067.1 hypothetical protein [Alphaproteobacteria bacterium]